MLKENRKVLIWGFLAFGILFLFFAFYFGKTENPYSGSQLAKISRYTGQVDLINFGMTKRMKVEKTESVQNLDSVQTDDIGEAVLTLETGQEIQVLPSSLVTIEKLEAKNQLQILLLIKAGNIQIKKHGREQSLYIGKNGGRIVAENYHQSSLGQMPAEENSATSIAENHFSQGLTEEEITATLSQHRTQFFKCFTRLLQQNPNVKGEAALTFTIQNNGHPSFLDVATKLGDEDFKNCLLEVMGRIEFKAFQGSSVSTVFPLKFEP